jgi:iron complex outermembrane receptor protein
VLDPTSGFFNTANAGKNKITGLEAELTAVPIPDLEIFGGLGYMHDKYTELDPLTGIRPDAHLPVTPKWNFNIGAQYTIETQNLGSLALRTDYNYRSEVSYGATNNPYEMQAGYGLLNLRATYTIPNKTISVAAYGLNVTDKRYHSNAQDVLGPLGVAFASIGAPREWGMELSAHF